MWSWLLLWISVNLCWCLDLKCEDKVINVEDSVEIRYPGGELSYPATTMCNWTFVGHSPLIIKFDKIELSRIVDTFETRCYDYVVINSVNGKVSTRCSKRDEFFKSDREGLQLRFVSQRGGQAGIEAKVWNQCPRYWLGCDSDPDEHLPDVSSVLLYRMKAFDGKDELRLPLSKDREVNGEVTLEMITFGSNRWSTACEGCDRVKLPTSQTPSCHFGHLDTCEWTVLEGQIESELFISKGTGILKTRRNDLELDSMCVYIEHVAETPPSAGVFANTGSEYMKLEGLIVLNSQEGRWNLTKISGRFPKSLVGKRLDLRLVFNGFVKVRKLFGCELSREESRFQLFSHTRFRGHIRGFGGKTLEKSANCLNGGRIEGDGGKCRCPAGVTGRRCETPCGANKLGPNCESECSSDEGGCRGMLLCKPGLECACAPGFKGNYCTVGCHSSEYGPGCALSCGRCAGDPPGLCNPYTGHCHRGCLPGYVPPYCQTVYVHFTTAPQVKPFYDNATLVVDFRDVHGVGTPKYFQIQTRKMVSDAWQQNRMSYWPLTPGSYKIDITGLVAGEQYDVRLVVFDSDLNKYDGGKVRVATFKTLCHPSYDVKVISANSTENSINLKWANKASIKWACPVNITVVEILMNGIWTVYAVSGDSLNITSLRPSMTYKVRLRPMTASNPVTTWVNIETKPRVTGQVGILKVTNVQDTSVILQWKCSSGSKNSTYNITYECSRLLASEDQYCGDDIGSFLTITDFLKLKGLKPFRVYRISVRELPGFDFTEIAVTTKDSLPTARPVLKELVRKRTEISMVWLRPVNASNLNGNFKNFHFILTRDESVILSSNSLSGAIRYYQLKPSTHYTVNVYLTNHLGWNKRYPLTVEADTLASAPGPVTELEAYKTGLREIGLRWGTPELSGGLLTNFRVRVDEREAIEEGLKYCTSWPEKYCYTIRDLKPGQDYTFKVSLKNDENDEFGSEVPIGARTEEDAPEAPTDLVVLVANERSLELRWKPPLRAWGVLNSFTLVAEQTSSHDTSNCCGLRIIRALKVEDEREFYSGIIDGLRPAAKYDISVLGETAYPGMAVRISAVTRPPKPGVIPPGTEEEITWILPPKDHIDDSLLETNLLLQLNSTDKLARHSLHDPDLFELVRSGVGGWFHVVGEYRGSEVLSLMGSKVQKKGRYGSIVSKPLEPGQYYTFAAVAVARYEYIYNVAIIKSKPFKI